MLYLIGLGLFDEGDLSLKGLEAIRMCDKAYYELYTSPWQGDCDKISKLAGKEITKLRRSDLEEDSGRIISEAKKSDIAILVPGDPLVATTHSSLISDARHEGIEVNIIHSSSVFSAIAECGLHIYKFGRTTTVAYPEKNYFPKTPYDILAQNKELDAHTLLLLDVKADQNRYMSVAEAIDILFDIESRENRGIFLENTPCVGIARLGGDTKIAYAGAKRLAKAGLGGPPHALIVPAKMHFSEEDFLEAYCI